jgi:phosphosulfolactate synthase (CoM biosynthesis protein A)
VLVSTGGFIEHVLARGSEALKQYLRTCKELAFDIVEVSSGFITVPTDDLVRLALEVKKAGMKPKPEVGIQFGAGGATTSAELEAEGTRNVGGIAGSFGPGQSRPATVRSRTRQCRRIPRLSAGWR